MVGVVVSVGSNIERDKNLRLGVVALRQEYGDLHLSSVYQSRAVGFEGDDFYNMALSFQTTKPVEQVVATLREIEEMYGRVRNCAKFSSRTLDLDILLYGDCDLREQGMDIPRAEIEKNAHVLQPLAEIAPQLQHPISKVCYQQLWQQFDMTGQELWVVPFHW